MSIILYCEQGHDLSVLDHTRIGHSMSSRVAAAQRQAFQDRMPRQPFCTKCGKPTIDACRECNAKISKGARPSYCGQCGKPFPWTDAALTAANALAAESEELSDLDKANLRASLPSLTVDTPDTQLAILRFKKIAGKAGPVIGKGIWEIVKQVAPALVKDAIEGKVGF